MAQQQQSIKVPFVDQTEQNGTVSVGLCSMTSDRLSLIMRVHWVATIGALAINYQGVQLTTPLVSTAICASILLFGLPHGTLDLALIQHSYRTKNVMGVVALYLGLAVAMYAVWQIAPVLALVAFFCLSISHFAEDWAGPLPPFIGHGIAAALLTAPAVLHPETLGLLLALLVGTSHAALVTDAAILVAPLSVVVASVGIVSLWIDKHRNLAIATALSLVGMIFLPPLVGFAVFFCLMHSPTQFSAGLHKLQFGGVMQLILIVGLLTLASLCIAALIYSRLAAGPMSTSVITSAFITLSVLTLPHMVMPTVTKHIASDQNPIAVDVRNPSK
jgi:beta-carotene 15,15'-dioxygenase